MARALKLGLVGERDEPNSPHRLHPLACERVEPLEASTPVPGSRAAAAQRVFM